MRWYTWRWWRFALSTPEITTGITWDIDGEWRPLVGRLWVLWWKNPDREVATRTVDPMKLP